MGECAYRFIYSSPHIFGVCDLNSPNWLKARRRKLHVRREKSGLFFSSVVSRDKKNEEKIYISKKFGRTIKIIIIEQATTSQNTKKSLSKRN